MERKTKKWVSKQCYRNSDKNEKNRRQFIELIILKSKGRMNFQIFFFAVNIAILSEGNRFRAEERKRGLSLLESSRERVRELERRS